MNKQPAPRYLVLVVCSWIYGGGASNIDMGGWAVVVGQKGGRVGSRYSLYDLEIRSNLRDRIRAGFRTGRATVLDTRAQMQILLGAGEPKRFVGSAVASAPVSGREGRQSWTPGRRYCSGQASQKGLSDLPSHPRPFPGGKGGSPGHPGADTARGRRAKKVSKTGVNMRGQDGGQFQDPPLVQFCEISQGQKRRST